jgi:hypothetical protein
MSERVANHIESAYIIQTRKPANQSTRNVTRCITELHDCITRIGRGSWLVMKTLGIGCLTTASLSLLQMVLFDLVRVNRRAAFPD